MNKELKETIAQFLNPKIECIEIYRSIVAANLPFLFYLDEEWASKLITLIFPNTNNDLWKIAWEGYIFYNNLNPLIYPIIRNQYKSAIDQMHNPYFSSRAKEHLFFHINLSFVHNLEDLSEDSLIKHLFNETNSSLRSKAMWTTLKIYEYLPDSEEKSKLIERLLELWEYRIKKLVSSDSILPKEKQEELKWYTFLFEKLEPKEDYLDLLLDVYRIISGDAGTNLSSIFQRLKEYLPINTHKVLQVLVELTKERGVSWLYIHSERRIIEILKNIEADYRLRPFESKIREIAELLAQKGFFKVRNEILPLLEA